MTSYDFAVIGGGLVGSAIAYGLARAGHQVCVLDEGDVAYRASRGNFGLVWVQGKGQEIPLYSEWSMSSASLWAGLTDELYDLTGIRTQHQAPGGVHLCYSADELSSRQSALESLSRATQGRFDFDMLDHDQLRQLIPEIGESVVGASWSRLDGHANPLYLLRALHAGIQHHGGTYKSCGPVRRIRPEAGSFIVDCERQQVHAARVVLAAGLGNRDLAPQVGLSAPLAPNRGEILVTERMKPLLNLPTTYLRQTGEGSILMGDSHEDVGFDDGTETHVLSHIAQRAVRALPALANTRVVRAWGALRVMTPDGYPLYEASETYPGAFVACCHSGVTLAAAHVKRLAPWIAGDTPPAEISPFTAERFHVQTATPV
ncbi:FAD-binding oxidoreductase [Halomonas sp. McH1-25]|uniref:NAD(P)/FAD-dependent oxidoreductase n=1 Tax=unclassified Halomonas TaxID=2609666 RepID=UPI001EF73B32|nr:MULTISPECIES: FAD-binding oxidoreductase [unclassified Halomonas]MCG7601130.1 FAD-binding oxidoreductase [Halomonas sp. McH1-25]MCP1344579.1 FAD-binding oxidoreductase [Halomonas sp. FL8]MCP1362593.1 FAD-binding oxidoreductase [Halomonas sp. BBD45]MCP1363973.1 FAD-binding oxidoreductase [Halomonas sp. BBD48]